MNSLEQFLALPDVDNIVEDVFVSKRVGKFKVRAMTQAEFKSYQNRAMSRVDKKGVSFDVGKYNLLVVVGQTVEPDFSSAELLKKCNCVDGEQLVNKKLLAGEITELARKIQLISGFDDEPDEAIEEAKN